MQIRNHNRYNINPDCQYFNFKNSNNKNKQIKSNNLTKTKVTGALAAGTGAIIAGLSMVSSYRKKEFISFVNYKTRDFMTAFCKIFFPNKNLIMQLSGNKPKDMREWIKNRITKDIIICLKRNAAGYVTPRGIKMNYKPANGCVLYGPESRAKEDTFKWMIEELRGAGVEIIEPKPGCKPKYDDISKVWDEMWHTKGSPAEAAKKFKKEGKYRALVIDGIDEIGQPPGIRKPLEHPENMLNDSPDTDSSVKKYGLFLIYKAKSIDTLMPGTVRTGRIDIRAYCMPYADEPLELWKEYLTGARNGDSGLVTQIIKQAKREMSKRGKAVMEEMKPYFVFDRPYEGIGYDEPLKKWENWINYTAKRRGLDPWSKIEEFRQEISVIVSEKSVMHTRESVDALKKEEKFQSILKMMTDKVKEIDPENKTWEYMYKATLNGCFNKIV